MPSYLSSMFIIAFRLQIRVYRIRNNSIIVTQQQHHCHATATSFACYGNIICVLRQQRWRATTTSLPHKGNSIYIIISLQIYNNKYKRQNVWPTNQTAIKQKNDKRKNGWQIDINELPTVFWVVSFEFWVLNYCLRQFWILNFEFWVLNCRLRRLGISQFWIRNL